MKYILLSLILFSSVLAVAEETELDKADLLTAQKKYEEALQVLRGYAEAHPGEVEPHTRIQRVIEKKSGEEAAIAEYRALFEKEPTSFHGYLYGKLIKSPVEREKLFREIVAKDPGYVWGNAGLATALMDQDRLQEGIDACKAEMKTVSEPTELHYIMARIYRRMKDYTNAAAEAREFYRLKPNDDSRGFAYSYEWMEVSNTENPAEQLKLAMAWSATYNTDLIDTKGLSGASEIAELLFIFADNDQEFAKTRKYAGIALEILTKEEPAKSGEERDLYFRVKGSLLALKAWAEIKLGGTSRVPELLRAAEKTGASSEMFYFSALAYKASGDNKQALKNSIKAATYPPVYSGAIPLAKSLWNQPGVPENGLEEALHKQRLEFAAHRKQRVIAQIVSEKFEPFEIQDASNKTLTAKDLSGKVTLMNFWAVWCPPCREELPHWNAFVAKHAADKDLQLLAIGDEPWETMQNYMANHQFAFPVYRNEKYWEQFGIEGIPTMLVIDRNGTIRFRSSGFEEGMEYEETLLWQIEAAKNSSR